MQGGDFDVGADDRLTEANDIEPSQLEATPEEQRAAAFNHSGPLPPVDQQVSPVAKPSASDMAYGEPAQGATPKHAAVSQRVFEKDVRQKLHNGKPIK